MGVIEVGKTILLDTNCFIYYFEDNPKYVDKLEKVFIDIEEGNNNAFMSIVSLMEILVKPKKENNIFIENRYKLMLTNYPNLSIIDMEYNIADIASRLRANYKIKTPDAIILATAIAMDANYILTNDIRLKNICNNERVDIVIIDDII